MACVSATTPPKRGKLPHDKCKRSLINGGNYYNNGSWRWRFSINISVYSMMQRLSVNGNNYCMTITGGGRPSMAEVEVTIVW